MSFNYFASASIYFSQAHITIYLFSVLILKLQYNLSLKEIHKSEIIHFADKEFLVTSFGNKVRIHDSGKHINFDLPKKLLAWPLYPFRLTRRLFRLDKMNVFVSSREKRELIILYQGILYWYSDLNGLNKIDKIKSGRNILHNSAALTPSGNLIFGEYFGNNKNIPVNIYSLNIKSKKLKTVYTFPEGSIRHVHGCFWDAYSEKVWIFTGDSDVESQILVADEDFDSVQMLGGGSQAWRAVSAFFTDEAVYWLMDSPLKKSRLVKYLRYNQEIVMLQEFPSPVYYSMSFCDGGYLIGTTHEPGSSVQGTTANIYFSDDLEKWIEIAKFEHDGLSLRFMKYGIIGFSAGEQSKDKFYLFGEALFGMDGKSFQCSLAIK